MEKHLYYYSNHTNYQADTNRSLPNVSYCDTQDEVHYNAYIPPLKIVATFNEPDYSFVHIIGYNLLGEDEYGYEYDFYDDSFSKIEVNGVEISKNDLHSNEGRVNLPNRQNTVTVVYTLVGTEIGEQAFFNCSALREVNIPNGVTSINQQAFFSCNTLYTLTIPNSVTSIGNSAFTECRNLRSVTIGNSVTSIGDEAFQSCEHLATINIPNSITTIGYHAFCECFELDATSNTAILAINPYGGCATPGGGLE